MEFVQFKAPVEFNFAAPQSGLIQFVQYNYRHYNEKCILKLKINRTENRRKNKYFQY